MAPGGFVRSSGIFEGSAEKNPVSCRKILQKSLIKAISVSYTSFSCILHHFLLDLPDLLLPIGRLLTSSVDEALIIKLTFYLLEFGAP